MIARLQSEGTKSSIVASILAVLTAFFSETALASDAGETMVTPNWKLFYTPWSAILITSSLQYPQCAPDVIAQNRGTLFFRCGDDSFVFGISPQCEIDDPRTTAMPTRISIDGAPEQYEFFTIGDGPELAGKFGKFETDEALEIAQMLNTASTFKIEYAPVGKATTRLEFFVADFDIAYQELVATCRRIFEN